MNVLSLVAPGPLPVVVHDPGMWWSTLVWHPRARLFRFSANAEWWKTVCRPGCPFRGSAFERAALRLRGKSLNASAVKAGLALDSLREHATFSSAERYIGAVGAVAEHLEQLNHLQRELQFSMTAGVRVLGLDYRDSHALVRYARSETLLAKLVELSLEPCQLNIDFLVLHITGPEDLLTTLISVLLLRRRSPSLHACLADHGHENFSLSPHLARLRVSGTLDTVFDTIIEAKDDRDPIVPQIFEALGEGRAVRGFVRRSTLDDIQPAVAIGRARGGHASPPAVPTFAPEPVFWTRISRRRCYWSRCTFCVHNAKYEDLRPPSLAEIPATVDRLEALTKGGYRTMVFSDEAVSPALLARFCGAVIERRLRLRWYCRCKLERAFDLQMFQQMRAAGCVEVMFGLESISPRMLRRMNKYVEGFGPETVEAVFNAAHDAGLGLHVNLMLNFPGDTPEEASASAEFLIRALRNLSNITFLLNRFVLFPDTDVMKSPDRFGVEIAPVSGDLVSSYPYRLASHFQANAAIIDQLLPSLNERIVSALGWRRFGRGLGAEAARHLYFLSAHSLIFKADPHNPFRSPLRIGAKGEQDDVRSSVHDRCDRLRRSVCAC